MTEYMIELNIKSKYFNAILEFKKPFELRHKPIERGTIVKLNEIGTDRYIIFESGKCRELKVKDKQFIYIKEEGKNDIIFFEQLYKWGDKFCGDYINEKQTYLI